MSVLHGTFRLSIVLALLAAAYYGITAYVTAVDANQYEWKLWTTLRCGERFLGQDMSSYTNRTHRHWQGGLSHDRKMALKIHRFSVLAPRPIPS
jgi:hypothetical protein